MALGIPMAMLLSSAIGSGAGLLGGLLGGKEQGQTGYDLIQPEYYTGAEDTIGQGWGYMSELINAMRRGEQPAWMSGTLDPIQQSMQQRLSNQFYGTAGRGGTLRDIQGMGAMAGVGPKALMNKSQQAAADFMSAGSQIDEYINNLRYQGMSNLAMNIPGMVGQMPASKPMPMVVPYGGGGGGGYDWGRVGSSIGQGLTNYAMYNALTPQTTQTTQTTSTPWGGTLNYPGYPTYDTTQYQPGLTYTYGPGKSLIGGTPEKTQYPKAY